MFTTGTTYAVVTSIQKALSLFIQSVQLTTLYKIKLATRLLVNALCKSYARKADFSVM